MMKKIGILLMNLGSPDSTSVSDVRRYLNEFLMDERVIDYPEFFRKLLVKGIIVPFRAPRSAKAYRSIWTEEGSPLIVLTKQLADKMREITDMPIEIAMRYGSFSPTEAFDSFRANYPDLDEVVLVPLYPHYAMSSYETAVEYAKEAYQNGNYGFEMSIVPPFYQHPAYINALAESIRPYLSDYDHILFSYHGIPQRHVKKTDPTGSHCLTNGCCDASNELAHGVCYAHQAKVTTMLVSATLGLEKNKFSQSYQSRLGKKWLQPYTDIRLKEMPKEGIKKLLVVCPAFVSDCLETIEEMGEEGKETFEENGGTHYTLIPCLNTSRSWLHTILTLVEETSEKTENVADFCHK